MVPTSAGGGFQNLHEEMSALVVISAWISCMYVIGPRDWERPCLIAGISAAVGVTILTQSIGMLLAFFFGLMIVWALATGNRRQGLGFGVLCAGAGATVAGVALLNYLATGLFSDQALDLIWRYANVERLDHWGVIPDLFFIMWIRNNNGVFRESSG
jgi:hypothetical protein